MFSGFWFVFSFVSLLLIYFVFLFLFFGNLDVSSLCVAYLCASAFGSFFDEMWQNQQQAGGKENTSPVQLSDGLHRIIFTTQQPFWILLIRGPWRTKRGWIIEEWTQIKTSGALQRYGLVSVSCAQHICKSSWTILCFLRFRTRASTSWSELAHFNISSWTTKIFTHRWFKCLDL